MNFYSVKSFLWVSGILSSVLLCSVSGSSNMGCDAERLRMIIREEKLRDTKPRSHMINRIARRSMNQEVSEMKLRDQLTILMLLRDLTEALVGRIFLIIHTCKQKGGFG